MENDASSVNVDMVMPMSDVRTSRFSDINTIAIATYTVKIDLKYLCTVWLASAFT